MNRKTRIDTLHESLVKSYSDLTPRGHLARTLAGMPKSPPSKKDLIRRLASNMVSSEFNADYFERREIVLNIFWLVDLLLNQLLANNYLTGKSDLEKKAFKEEVAFEIPFTKKLAISKQIGFSKKAGSIVYSLNELRVAFAHGFKKINSKYKYKGKHSVFDDKTIELVWGDFEFLTEEFSCLFNPNRAV